MSEPDSTPYILGTSFAVPLDIILRALPRIPSSDTAFTAVFDLIERGVSSIPAYVLRYDPWESRAVMCAEIALDMPEPHTLRLYFPLIYIPAEGARGPIVLLEIEPSPDDPVAPEDDDAVPPLDRSKP